MGRPGRGLKALGHDARLSCFDREFKDEQRSPRIEAIAQRSSRSCGRVERLKDLELENSRPFT